MKQWLFIVIVLLLSSQAWANEVQQACHEGQLAGIGFAISDITMKRKSSEVDIALNINDMCNRRMIPANLCNKHINAITYCAKQEYIIRMLRRY